MRRRRYFFLGCTVGVVRDPALLVPFMRIVSGGGGGDPACRDTLEMSAKVSGVGWVGWWGRTVYLEGGVVEPV